MKKWVIQIEHTGVLTKNLILIRFYIFMHRLPAPSEVEHLLSYYLGAKKSWNFERELWLNQRAYNIWTNTI